MSKPSLRFRLTDFAVMTFVAALCASAWTTLPEELVLGDFRCRCHASLLVFAALAAAASYFVILVVEEQVTVASEHPAAWLGAQVILWNPLAWLWLMHRAGAQAPGLVDEAAIPLAVGLVGVIAWGGATSLAAWHWCSSRRWRVVFFFRFLQALVAGFVPTLPALAFIGLLLFMYQWTIDRRYDTVHHVALRLVVAEQLLATIWFAVFSNVNAFG